ncbi:DegT/DnrJ/EryC1/StrS family aminotransferase, partial [bacterium]|nr:DegT/DnrJ/EryC1/StrS family aminotransferase [bacterium]
EDAAEGLGSEYKGCKAGSMADLGVFSFHGTKTVTTGEGGVLVCNRDGLVEQITILDNHGRDPKIPKMFWCEQVGLKYKMSNLQAALGCAQMERIEELVEKKRKVFNWYKIYSAGISDITWNPELENTKNSYWMPTLILGETHGIGRDQLIDELNRMGINAAPFFYPISSFPMFEKIPENIVSYQLYNRGINLPNYFDLTEDDVGYVCKSLKELL